MKQNSIKDLLGCLPKALLWNFVIGAAALLISIFLGGPKIYIDLQTAVIVFCAMLLPYIAITWWSILALSKNSAVGILVTDGPYSYSRNPMYAAIIFILNPALGILFRSWLLFFAAIPIYFIWRQFVRAEEDGPLIEKFGAVHSEYMKTTPRFFPNLRKINPILFYSSAGILIFLISFISLNSSSLYLRWVIFETHAEITYDKPSDTLTPTPSQFFPLPDNSAPIEPETNRANYSANADTIIIGKLGIRAPLIWATGESQKQLNDALNQGVILYPGSAVPGQNGEVVLSGHSSVFPWVKTQYGQVFTLLDKLAPGDIVSIVYNHKQYDYRMTGQEILNPNQVKISDTTRPVLKMTTCWPIGTSAKRLVVYGELIQ